ncbi:hypothetical protein WAI453_010612 [Rhynchosporium graminicola]
MFDRFNEGYWGTNFRIDGPGNWQLYSDLAMVRVKFKYLWESTHVNTWEISWDLGLIGDACCRNNWMKTCFNGIQQAHGYTGKAVNVGLYSRH